MSLLRFLHLHLQVVRGLILGKGHRLGHQRQGHRQARQHVILYGGNFTGVKLKHRIFSQDMAPRAAWGDQAGTK